MIMGNLAIILIGAGDVFVAAKHSTNTLAAVSIANSVMSIVLLFGLGLLASISPLLSNYRGAKSTVKKYFLPCVNFSQIIALISFFLILFCIFLLQQLQFEPSLFALMKKYMFVCSFSVFSVYLQVALKEYLQTFEIVIFPNLVMLLGVIIHLYLDFVFVFGWYGLPEMGAVGLAVATLISRVLIAAVLLFYSLKAVRVRYYSDFMFYVNLLKIGFPIAVAAFIESAAYNIVTLLAGKFSGLYAAAQSILLTITTATFMIPFAIANATAVKVGYANGAKNFVDLKKYAISGAGISTIFMTFCALLLIVFPAFFIKIFTNDAKLIEISVPIMILIGVYQIFDGIQVTLAGIFKGLKKTKIVLAGNFVAFWLMGLPLGLLLAYKFDMGLYGFWVGLTVALVILSSGLILMLSKEFLEIYKAEPIK